MKIILLWNPMSTQRIYLQRWKIRFMKKDAKELKESYIRQVHEQRGDQSMITDLVEIEIDLYFWDKRKRDRDNFHKIAIDSIAGIVLEDDVLIQKATVIKHYDKENPRYEMKVKKSKNLLQYKNN